MLLSLPLIAQLVCPKNKDILSHNRSSVIKIKKLTLIQCHNLIYRPHFDFCQASFLSFLTSHIF